jgi:NitT/TauT family transport system substrate-binding protein
MRTTRGVLVACITGALVAGFTAPAHAQAKKVTLQLDWVVSAYHAGAFVAKEKGFYTAKGLDVTINRGFGSGDTIKVVAAGSSNFGLANIPASIISRGKGALVKQLAVLVGKAPESILSFEEKGIRQVKDVEGKSFAEAAGAAIMVVWPAFAKHAGIDVAKVTHIPVEAAAKAAAFFSGRVDWVAGFRPGFDETVIVRARKDGKKLVFIKWEDLGWKVYGSGIITSDDFLKREPKLTADFIEATLDGYAYTIEHPDEALEIALKANPELSPEIARLSLLFGLNALITPAARSRGVGYMDPERMSFQIDLMSRMANITPPKAEEVYTNQFIKPKRFTVPAKLEAELAALP